ncbi:MAG TPA: YciI family protein, partial [Acetobacteraceae bacterium]|nr:YciI family protein [Acetobacteraceae bacterium]
MRYVMMHKTDRNTEAGVMPPQELIAGMGRLIGDMIKSGTFLDAGGLRPSQHRVRVVCLGGKATVTKGPFTAGHDVLAGFMAIKVKTIDEAVAWTKRCGAILGDAEFEIGPMTESWDLGGPKPEGEVPLRCLVLHKATRASEAGTPLPVQQQAAAAKLFAEMKQQGVLLFHE